MGSDARLSSWTLLVSGSYLKVLNMVKGCARLSLCSCGSDETARLNMRREKN